MSRVRLDAELVRRGLARSREHAREVIEAGHVRVQGSYATKASTQVEKSAAIVVDVDDSGAGHYVSRGAHKLIGAFEAFPAVVVAGRGCLDAGASTGGFTQVLLERGATRVTAVDVGYGQLAWSLRTDERVIVMERTNVRTLRADDLQYRPTLVVSDLSFIPLELVLPALVACVARPGDLVLMVKPQFEVGRERVGDGVVRDPVLRADAVRGVAEAGIREGLIVRGVAASPLPGPSGNVEYFLWMSAEGAGGDTMEPGLTGDVLDEAINRAVAEGPQ